MGPPKRFVIMDLIEINTAPEGIDPFGFRPATRFLEHSGNRKGVRKYADA
jgi:hypothetical protein